MRFWGVRQYTIWGRRGKISIKKSLRRARSRVRGIKSKGGASMRPNRIKLLTIAASVVALLWIVLPRI